ncbi:MAG: response regulator [Desulfosarcinaceae bacterium]|jgi:two-component system chemotaxis response regulator CheY
MGKRILIVDDSSIMRKMIKQTLADGGHTIIGEANNGADAVTLYKNLQPDLVTMDITMRGMDGFTAAKEIREYDNQAQIVFLSNLDEEKYSRDVASIGALGYVNKHEAKQILSILAKL